MITFEKDKETGGIFVHINQKSLQLSFIADSIEVEKKYTPHFGKIKFFVKDMPHRYIGELTAATRTIIRLSEEAE